MNKTSPYHGFDTFVNPKTQHLIIIHEVDPEKYCQPNIPMVQVVQQRTPNRRNKTPETSYVRRRAYNLEWRGRVVAKVALHA